jgi:hypothetical protein
MEKGHIELGEILFVALLIVGLAAAVFIFSGQKPVYLSEPGNSSESAPSEPPADKEPASGNTTRAAQIPPQPEPVQLPIVNTTMGAILENGLSRADSKFYSTVESGQYEINTYKWTMGKQNDSPDSIPLKPNDLRALDVRFNKLYVDSLRGFAFRVYSYSGYTGPPKIYGVAAFISDSNPLNGLNSTIDIHYDPHPEGAQILEGCRVLATSESVTIGGTPLDVYDLECKIMYGANS